MLYTLFALIVVTFITIGSTTPITYANSVGKVQKIGQKTVVKNTGDYGFVVHIKIQTVTDHKHYKKYICGGIILREDVVLTDAHCIKRKGERTAYVTVVGGVVDLDHEDQITQVIDVVGYKIHEDYKEIGRSGLGHKIVLNADLAVLWLQRNLRLGPTVKIAELPKKKFIFDDREGIVVGWGHTEFGMNSPILRKAIFRGISNKQCRHAFENEISWKKQFCVVSKNKISILSNGDSGSPLVFRNIVLGLASYGVDAKDEDYGGTIFKATDPEEPIVFTNLFDYQGWLRKTQKIGRPTKKCKDFVKPKFCLL